MSIVRLECGHSVQVPFGLSAGDSYPCPLCGEAPSGPHGHVQSFYAQQQQRGGVLSDEGAFAIGIFAGPLSTDGHDVQAVHAGAAVAAHRELAGGMAAMRRLAERAEERERAQLEAENARLRRQLAAQQGARSGSSQRLLDAARRVEDELEDVEDATFEEVDEDEEEVRQAPKKKAAKKKAPAKKAKKKAPARSRR